MKKLSETIEALGILILYLFAVIVCIGLPISFVAGLLWFIYKLLTGLGSFILEALRIIFN